MGTSVPNMQDITSRDIFGKVFKTCAVVLILASVMALAKFSPFVAHFTQLMATWQLSRMSVLYFFLIGIPYAALGMPRQALCVIAGLIFGVTIGLLLALATTLGGNLVDFYVARLSSKYRAPGGRTSHHQGTWRMRSARLQDAVRRAPFQTILILRLMPVGSALLVALGAGYFDVPVGAFIAATLLGSFPQNLVFVLIGSGAHVGHGFQILLGIALFAVSLGLGFLLILKERG